jgi:hypothetical protein
VSVTLTDTPVLTLTPIDYSTIPEYITLEEKALVLIPHAPTFYPGQTIRDEMILPFDIDAGLAVAALQLVLNLNTTYSSSINMVNHLTEYVTSSLTLKLDIDNVAQVSGRIMSLNHLLDAGTGIYIGDFYFDKTFTG